MGDLIIGVDAPKAGEGPDDGLTAVLSITESIGCEILGESSDCSVEEGVFTHADVPVVAGEGIVIPIV